MGFEKMLEAMSSMDMRTRSGYHLTFGELVKALKSAPSNLVFDTRIKGVGSYRGYYSDIALFTEEEGMICSDEEYEYGSDNDYSEWEKNHVKKLDKIPTNANELGKTLEAAIGMSFTGYKGGEFTITEDKPLWFEVQDSMCSGVAVVGIAIEDAKELKLVTKELDQDE